MSVEAPPSASDQLDRLRDWFRGNGWSPFPFQERAWAAQAEGSSGLIHVPTGAGKTYAAFLRGLAEIVAEAEANGGGADGIRVLYITPLRAVSRDIAKAMRRPIDDLELPVSLETRTGDTSSSVRAKQRDRLPNVLITTPESLCLLLTQEKASDRFGGLSLVILDEWHELLASKRGSQTELALTRLRAFSGRVRTWALSATIANTLDAAQAAAGAGSAPEIVSAELERPVHIDAVIPEPVSKIPWAGHLGLVMLDDLLARLDPAISTLVFCNTRSQAERWFHAIQHERPSWTPVTALHHGSIDRDERERIEAGLKDGTLRLVVATSSLDLGVDFSPVERVVQVGSPKGLARLMQRAGRAGHRPCEECSILCVPTHGMELVEIAAVRRGLEAGRLEPRDPESKPLDVLAQHMVTCALGGGFEPDALFRQIRSAASYRTLTRDDFDWTLHLVEHGGGTLRAYPEYCKIVPDESGVYRVPDRRIAQVHRMNVGTITGDSSIPIRFVAGRSLGSIEERFVGLLRPGERFVFAGKVLSFVRMHDGTALVRKASGTTTYTPHWAGTRLPISESMSQEVRDTLEAAGGGDRSTPELDAAAGLVKAQARMSRVPRADQLLVELTTTREGRHLFLFPFEGRLVHGGLAALLAYRVTRDRSSTLSIAFNDYGLELLGPEGYPFEEHLSPELFTDERLVEDTLGSVNLSELAKLRFRDIARVAGLVFQQFPGGKKRGRQLSASSSLIFDVLTDFDPDHLLLAQARREVMERQFEQSRLKRLLARLRGSEMVVVETDRPTPLGFPLIIERTGGQLSSETILQRLAKMRTAWEVE
ncbi:MAG: ligase-associated DNA damage response DEXH box helicase [Planctomycetota bacterium]